MCWDPHQAKESSSGPRPMNAPTTGWESWQVATPYQQYNIKKLWCNGSGCDSSAAVRKGGQESKNIPGIHEREVLWVRKHWSHKGKWELRARHLQPLQVGHRSPVCQSKYLGKPAAAKAAATEQEQPTPSTSTPKGKASVSTTTPVLAKDSKGQADLLAQLMAQIKKQSAQIEALKASF